MEAPWVNIRLRLGRLLIIDCDMLQWLTPVSSAEEDDEEPTPGTPSLVDNSFGFQAPLDFVHRPLEDLEEE